METRFDKIKLLKIKRLTGFALTKMDSQKWRTKLTFISGYVEIILEEDDWSVYDFEDKRGILSDDELWELAGEISEVMTEDWEVCIECDGLIHPGDSTINVYSVNEETNTLNMDDFIGVGHENCVEIYPSNE